MKSTNDVEIVEDSFFDDVEHIETDCLNSKDFGVKSSYETIENEFQDISQSEVDEIVQNNGSNGIEKTDKMLELVVKDLLEASGKKVEHNIKVRKRQIDLKYGLFVHFPINRLTLVEVKYRKNNAAISNRFVTDFISMLYSLNLSPKNGLMITNSTYNIIGRESADKEGLKLYDWLDLLGMIYKTSPRSKRKHIMPTWKNCKQFYDQLNEAEIRKYRLNQKLGNQVTITDRLLKRFFEKSYLKEKKEIHTKINDLKILINRCKIDLKRLSKRYDLPNIDELIQNV